MDALKLILTIVYLLVCVGLVVLVLLQESKSRGLAGAIGGGSVGTTTYYSKNKGRTKEGRLNKLTIVLGVLFIVLSVVLNLTALQ